MSRLVTVENLAVRFSHQTVIDGVGFHLDAGECVALVGESGSGKTLTARALLGLVPTEADVTADRLDVVGHDGLRLSPRQWRGVRGHDVGLISQDALVALDPLRRIGAEVAEALRVHAGRDGEPRTSRRDVRARVLGELGHVAVPDPDVRIDQYAHELSGGLRQRALVASATINRPQLLIADEPTTALDVSVQMQVLQLLERLKSEGTGLLLISHDLAVVAQIADRVAVMRHGQVVESGPSAAVLSNPAHEYTRLLLAAEPSLHPRGTRLSSAGRLHLGAEAVPGRPDDDTSTPVLRVDDVAKSYRRPDGTRLAAVDGVSVELHAGRTVGIVGESGSGKTTLGRIIMGLEVPDRGEVQLDGRPWSALPERSRHARRGMLQAVYQDPLSSFDPRAKVGAILREALALTGVARRDRHTAARDLIARVGLSADLLQRRPRALSGGQRQRVAIARALAREPRILLADEPVSALDVAVQAQVLDGLSDVQEQLGLAMLFISHDLGVVQHMSDDLLVMRRGVVVESGPSAEIFDNPQHEYTRELIAALPATRYHENRS